MLQWLSWSSFLHKRSLAAVGTILTILIACSCFLPMRHGVIGAAQTRLSSESSADLWPISIDYPENGSIFPPGITPPTFIWRDAAASSWQIEIVFADKSAPMHFQPKAERMHLGAIDPECISNTNELPKLTPQQASSWTWTPDASTWQDIQAHSKESPATFTITGSSQARGEVFKLREARIKQWNAERDAALDVARKAAALKVSQAKAALDAEAALARADLQASAGDLARQVVRAVLPVAAGGSR